MTWLMCRRISHISFLSLGRVLVAVESVLEGNNGMGSVYAMARVRLHFLYISILYFRGGSLMAVYQSQDCAIR